MIEGFVGVMGSSKTLSMTVQALHYISKGYKVYSNYHLNYVPYEPLNFDDIFSMADEQGEMNNVVILLDEVHIVLDSRSSMSKANKTITFWLNQTRKMGVKLLYTTQYDHQVDRRLRAGTNFWNFCESSKYLAETDKPFYLTQIDTRGRMKKIKFVPQVGVEYVICTVRSSNGDQFAQVQYVGNPLFKYYDTNQIIEFFKKPNKEAKKNATDDETMREVLRGAGL